MIPGSINLIPETSIDSMCDLAIRSEQLGFERCWEIVEKRGLRALLSFEASERSGSKVAQKGIDENIRLIETNVEGNLVSGFMSVHTTFTCSDNFLRHA